jgi:hypothetical protein
MNISGFGSETGFQKFDGDRSLFSRPSKFSEFSENLITSWVHIQQWLTDFFVVAKRPRRINSTAKSASVDMDRLNRRKMKKITIVAGAYPQLLKLVPIIHTLKTAQENGKNIMYQLVYIGQQDDTKVSVDYFKQLEIPKPDINLEVGAGPQAEQIANIMIRFENYLTKNPSDLVLIVGDMFTTMACAIVAQKLHTKVAHLKKGGESKNWTLPEEIMGWSPIP